MLKTSQDPLPADALSPGQCASALGISTRTLSRWLHDGRLRCWAAPGGRLLRVSLSEARQVFAKRPRPGESKRREAEKAEATRWCRERLGLDKPA